MPELKRLNLRMGQGLYDFYKAQADELGVSVSNLMIMTLAEYRRQHLAVNFVSSASKAEMEQIMKQFKAAAANE